MYSRAHELKDMSSNTAGHEGESDLFVTWQHHSCTLRQPRQYLYLVGHEQSVGPAQTGPALMGPCMFQPSVPSLYCGLVPQELRHASRGRGLGDCD